MKIWIEDNLCTVYKLVLHQMQKALLENGFELADAAEQADVLLAGVCVAFEADEKRSMAIIDRLRRLNKPLLAYGCLIQVRPELFSQTPAYASWQAPSLVRALTQDRVTFSMARALPTTFRCAKDYRVQDPYRVFIGISTGCSFDCSFCPHKRGAGFIRSIPQPEIVAQVEKAVAAGAKTLILTGLDTACYGEDLGGSFADLLGEVLETIGPETRLHIAQFNPEGLFFSPYYTRKMIEMFSDPRVRDIQLPIQTDSSRLLALMNRHYDPIELADFLALLKARNPGVRLRTDLMVGFPTEAEAELKWSVGFVIRYFSEAAVYGFEMKPGTAVAKMNLPQVPAKEIRGRVDRAERRLKAAGVLIHGGGQRLETLLENDRKKEARWW
jgi:tRNA A37 methylthiotransferase MiaB